jgi:hypothetical protein
MERLRPWSMTPDYPRFGGYFTGPAAVMFGG